MQHTPGMDERDHGDHGTRCMQNKYLENVCNSSTRQVRMLILRGRGKTQESLAARESKQDLGPPPWRRRSWWDQGKEDEPNFQVESRGTLTQGHDESEREETHFQVHRIHGICRVWGQRAKLAPRRTEEL